LKSIQKVYLNLCWFGLNSNFSLKVFKSLIFELKSLI
jgi:hypothetical protein